MKGYFIGTAVGCYIIWFFSPLASGAGYLQCCALFWIAAALWGRK